VSLGGLIGCRRTSRVEVADAKGLQNARRASASVRDRAFACLVAQIDTGDLRTAASLLASVSW
jgi:hypothetical protein